MNNVRSEPQIFTKLKFPYNTYITYCTVHNLYGDEHNNIYMTLCSSAVFTQVTVRHNSMCPVSDAVCSFNI